jgi:O-antigen/teichoic acid export membrane protein
MTEPASSASSKSFVSDVRSGAFWTVLGQGGAQVIRFGANLVLTRLLLSEHFGMLQLATVFMIGLGLFSDVGLAQAMIQNPRAEERHFRNTVYSVHVIRGATLFAVAAILAYPFALFYKEGRLFAVIVAYATTLFINGCVSMNLFVTRRHLKMRPLAILQLASQIGGTLTCIVFALVWPTVWALVANVIVSTLVLVVGSYLYLDGERDGFAWDKAVLSELFRFGRWVFLSTALTFAVSYCDRLVFAKLIPFAAFGVYGIATALARLPAEAFNEVAQQVLFPVWSRANASGDDALLSETFARTRAPFLVLAGWIVSGMAAGGQVIFNILYDQRYQDGGWMVRIIALGVWVQMLEQICSSALLAKGQSRWMPVTGVVKLVAVLVFIPIGYRLGAFPGALIGYTTASVPAYLTSAYAAHRHGLRAAGRDAAYSGWLVLSILCTLTILSFVSRSVTNHWALASIVFVVCSAFWLPLGLRYAKHLRPSPQAA